MSKPPPPPFKILRAHNVQINTIYFSYDNEFLVAGDSSGRVTVTSTRSFRPVADWKAHEDSLLGLQEWDKKVITHGRDNKLHFWSVAPAAPLLADAAETPNLSIPTLVSSMDVNALNYCRFSLYSIPRSNPPRALLALPNLIESELIDVWEVPSGTRLHAGIGTIKGAPARTPFSDEGRDIYKSEPLSVLWTLGPNLLLDSGFRIVMSLHISQSSTHMRVLAAYESGSVTLRTRPLSEKPRSIEGDGWEITWHMKHHLEAVMGMAVTQNNILAATVSADHLICRYSLAPGPGDNIEELPPHETKHPGNGAVAFRADGRVLGVAGWDGAIRLYSTGLRRRGDSSQAHGEANGASMVIDHDRKMRALGTLEHFKESCFAIAFANEVPGHLGAPPLDEDNMSEMGLKARSRWLAVGGKNGRVAIWELHSFEKR